VYGHWYTIANDKYELNNNIVTIDSSMLDSNTMLVEVTYYCPESLSTQYLMQVYGEQSEYGHNPPISQAKIEIQRYLPYEDSFVTISSVLTDADGQADIFLYQLSLIVSL